MSRCRRHRVPAVAVAMTASLAIWLVPVLGNGAAAADAAQAPTQGDVQQAIRQIVQGGAPGATAVIQGPGGEERFSAGDANLRAGTPISPDDHARVGSATKVFTAALVLKLVARGTIGLNDTVEKWLPGLVPNGDQISVRELLDHTSGLANYCSVPPSSTLCAPPLKELARSWTPSQLVHIAVAAPPIFAPGRGWSYSNTGYVLLGMIVEKATGQPFATVLRHDILQPLHLDHTELPNGTAMPQPYSHGYDVLAAPGGPQDVTGQSPTIAWTAGGLVSTPGDLAAFMRALLLGRVIPPKLLKAMERATPGSLNGPHALEGGGAGSYGLGLIHFTWSYACGAWGHLGDFPGYHTIALASSNGKRSAALYVNSDGLSEPGALATLRAERLLACRMQFGDIGG